MAFIEIHLIYDKNAAPSLCKEEIATIWHLNADFPSTEIFTEQTCLYFYQQ